MNVKFAKIALFLVMSSSMLLVGCGRKGPLTLEGVALTNAHSSKSKA